MSTCLCTFLASADEYSVLEEKGVFLLIKNQQVFCEIITVGGVPRFIKQKSLAENSSIVLLKYFAGTAGTHILIDNYRACIYDMKKRVALTDIPYRYEAGQREMQQPRIVISEDLITVYDPQTEQTVEVKLN